MIRLRAAAAVVLMPTFAVFAQRPSPDVWRDPAPHSVHLVQVARGVRLHYLDFGGTGPALVFLAGLGNTAHAFDDFAPAFADRFHVIAITRRGSANPIIPRRVTIRRASSPTSSPCSTRCISAELRSWGTPSLVKR